MKGFDSEFVDLPDYIIRITERIWEGRQVAAIRRYYGENCPVRSPAGVVVGADAVVAATLATLAEFPDRRLLPEEVVWSGNADDGFLSSHRILSTATHSGNGAYGRASGARLRYRIIADCVVRGNQVTEEWLVRDQAAIARGLGMTAQQLAARQIAAGDAGFFTPETDVAGRYSARMSADSDAADYCQLWQDLWRGDLSQVGARYHPSAVVYAPGGDEATGHEEIDRYHLGWLAAVGGAQFAADELTVVENANGKTAAMRWSVRGAHTGFGVLAPDADSAVTLSGAPLYIMGISHAKFVAGKIIAEWIQIDPIPLWKQILTAV